MTSPALRRRRFLQLALTGAAGSALPALAWSAQARDTARPRLVFVILRGGMDGLAALPPVGDPQLLRSREALMQFGAPPLPVGDGYFALHPALARLHGLFATGQALALHAVGLPYRERSHFDAQQVLESGGARPHELDTGWLGRALAATGAPGLALATAVPLALRGSPQVDSWAPSVLPEPPDTLLDRLATLYEADPELSAALARARMLHDDPGMPGAAMSRRAARQAPGALMARRAAEWLAAGQGPAVAVLEIGGWDTHTQQAQPKGALARQLAQLDGVIAALHDGLAPAGAWRHTAILVATEFGRQVAPNGTQGSDHGSGGAAWLVGGAVRGGQVLADWPGLAPHQLHERRDLRTTTDLRAAMRTLLHQHLGVSRAALDRTVLPGTAALGLPDLLRG